MRKLVLLMMTMVACPAFCQEEAELTLPPNGDNEKAEVSQWMGPVKVTIAYHSPDVHGPGGEDRKGHIWGELVHYGFIDQGFGPAKSGPWRAGANESTIISFSHDVRIGGKEVKAGTYALFLDVEKEGPWNWIISSHRGWGSYQYDSKHDVVRIAATPEDAPYTEWLTYGFDHRLPGSTVAFLQWEDKRVSLKIEVPDIDMVYVDQIRRDLLGWAGFNYQNWQTAAAFCAQRKINLEEALTWADKAIYEPFRGATFGRPDFSTFQTKAQVLLALHRDEEAAAIMDEAIKLPGVSAFNIYVYSRTLLTAGKSEKSLEVAKYNLKIHPEETFWTYLGLARGYTALADKKNAVKNWEIALRNVPPSQKSRIPAFESELKKMKEME